MNFAELSKEIMIRKSGEKQGNIRLSIDDWLSLNKELLNFHYYKVPEFVSSNYELKFMGVPIIFYSSGIMAWIECEYCRTTELPNKNNGYTYCSKCGGLV